MNYRSYSQHLAFPPPVLYQRPGMRLPVQYHVPAYHVPGAAIPADHLPGVAIPAAAAAPASTVFSQRLMHHLAAVLLASLPHIVPAPNGVNFCAAAADDDDDDDIVACVFGVL